jgi:hypothetical protein
VHTKFGAAVLHGTVKIALSRHFLSSGSAGQPVRPQFIPAYIYRNFAYGNIFIAKYQHRA